MSLKEIATQLASSAYLKCILSYHVVASVVAIASLCTMQWHRNARKLLAHSSLVLLMDFHTFWTLLVCVSTLVNSVLTLRAHLTMRDPSDLFVTASTCALRRAPLIVAAFGAIFSQCVMAAERYMASKNVAGYERTNCCIGSAFNVAHLLATALGGTVHMAVYGTDWTAAHCTMITSAGGMIHTIMPMVTMVCEIITIVIFNRLLSTNRKVHARIDAGLTLSERYQLAENIRMLKLLLPIIWSHTLLGIAASGQFFIGKLIFPSTDLYPLVEETTSTLHLQGIIMPLIFWIRLREKRIHEQEVRAVNMTRGEALATHHTRAITENW